MSHRCLCSIIPPHMLDQLAKSGDAAQRTSALASIQLTERLRGQRDILGLLPAMSITPGEHRRTIYTAAQTQNLPGTVVRGEGQAPVGDAAADQAYDAAGIVWEFYKSVFNRDSIDGRGMRLDSTVHYGSGFDNAFWNGSQMVYGDGDGTVFHNFTGSLDVIAHEMTHGVTQSESALLYAGESGALNESLSDVFGSLAKQQANGETADQADWLIGVGILVDPNARAIRDMRNPGTAYNVPTLGPDPQPSTYVNLYKGPFDNGGVHINSGIPNKAFATYALAIGGQAWTTAGHVWYAAATASGLPATARFSQFKAITLQVAQRDAPATVGELQAAWDGVGVP